VHQLQSCTLELCFFIALDRLRHGLSGSGGGGGAWSGAAEVPLLNTLVTVLKHLQVQQRRDALKQPLLAIKVELKQLVFSIARCCSPLRLCSSSLSSPSLAAACL
jgi:hypothetical protein